jgi:hypothetical protein
MSADLILRNGRFANARPLEPGHHGESRSPTASGADDHHGKDDILRIRQPSRKPETRDSPVCVAPGNEERRRHIILSYVPFPRDLRAAASSMWWQAGRASRSASSRDCAAMQSTIKPADFCRAGQLSMGCGSYPKILALHLLNHSDVDCDPFADLRGIVAG